jgi:cell division protein FtsI/penicillin-binding protein 2
MEKLAVPPATGLADTVASFRDGLHITSLTTKAGAPVVDGGAATVPFSATVGLAGLGTWSYDGSLSLVLPSDAKDSSAWKVVWSRRDLHPLLTGTAKLRVVRSFAPRGALLAADGSPLPGSQLTGGVGTADEASTDRLVGDPIGTSGLQAAFDAELGGAASGDVQLVEGDQVLQSITHIDGRAPVSVRTSLDPKVQAAGQAVLGTLMQPAALVAIRPSTGELLAAVSNPPVGFNRALNGRYPPGSTFKTITSTALLEHGVAPDFKTTCPPEAVINGRHFKNAEDEQLGDIIFRTAYVHSCNTAFVQLSTQQLDAATLTDVATFYGFNAPPALEVAAETSEFPEPHSLVDQASASIGQGRVLATPLQMASVAATVASGTHRPITLHQVTTPTAGDPMPSNVALAMQDFMRGVVAEGTATAARLPGEPVAGKTGTAEFGTEKPPHTHAWFIGFRGDLAFAVIVEDGGFGGKVAAPLARDFLSRL